MLQQNFLPTKVSTRNYDPLDPTCQSLDVVATVKISLSPLTAHIHTNNMIFW